MVGERRGRRQCPTRRKIRAARVIRSRGHLPSLPPSATPSLEDRTYLKIVLRKSPPKEEEEEERYDRQRPDDADDGERSDVFRRVLSDEGRTPPEKRTKADSAAHLMG